jgi:hypothetical protein
MLPRSVLSLVLSLLWLTSYGQSSVPGYVVTAGQDSIRGVVFIQDDFAQQAQVDFIPLQGNQRLVLNAFQLKAYGYIRKQDTVRYVAIALNYGKKSGVTNRIFLRQLVAGPVELYQYYYNNRYFAPQTSAPAPKGTPLLRPTASTAAHPALYTPLFGEAAGAVPQVFSPLSAQSARFGTGNSLLVRRRVQNNVTEVTWWDFPTDAAAYFADCPALAADLRAKHYRPRDIANVLRRYNAWWPTAQPGK